ncbi:MAG: hypothetical protein MJA83_15945, partial [Gammaproteobacteria bacterium]|nr:hypothetical protein [Gammaproteobacteria bacterium]
MPIASKHNLIGPLLLSAILAGCGGDDGGGITDSSGSSSPIGAPTAGGVTIGAEIGGSFQAGTLDVAIAPPTQLPPGGATDVEVQFRNVADNSLFTESVTIEFTSDCVALGFATIDASVTTSSGIANADYVSSGCGTTSAFTDTIRATATVNGQQLGATGTVILAPAAIGSINFVSATPTNIGLKGTGGTGRSETSTVIFQVVNETGG